MNIHPTALIDPQAKIAEGVLIGPYCIVGPFVTLEKRVILKSHVVIEGRTTVSEDTEVFPFASLGSAPQDLKFQNEESTLLIGARCKIREHVTMNPGTKSGRMQTQVGNDCLFMMGSHVAHDCIVGNNVILANNATLAGHVEVGDHVIIGGLSAVHQFVRIGAHAMVGGMTGVKNDVIPYGMVMDETGYLAGLNYVGLERRGYTKKQIQSLLRAFRQLFEEEVGTFSERLEEVGLNFKEDPDVMKMIAFIQANASRSVLKPRHGQHKQYG